MARIFSAALVAAGIVLGVFVFIQLLLGFVRWDISVVFPLGADWSVVRLGVVAWVIVFLLAFTDMRGE